MSIEKYLKNINLPETPSGPFGVRLKYELRKELFEQKRNFTLVYALSSAVTALFILSIGLIVRPDFASKIHYALHPQSENLDMILEDGKAFATHRNGSEIQTIPFKDLSQLDDKKTYVIKKVKGRQNKNYFYVTEMNQQSATPKIAY